MPSRIHQPIFTIFVLSAALGFVLFTLRGAFALVAPAKNPPTFYRDVLPILQEHCQSCHRAGGIAPMPFETAQQTRPYAAAIHQATQNKSMPPWFADANVGHFSNDPSLTPEQIATLAAWAEARAPVGEERDAQPARMWAESWSIPQPDLILKMPQAAQLPANGDIEYTYEIVPTHFSQDRWVQMAEVLPALRSNVHHAVVYVRPPDSKWLQHAPVGVPFTASTLSDPEDRRGAHWTESDILLVYAPGSSPDMWPANMAKFIPAGSDLVFQMHLRGKRFEYNLIRKEPNAHGKPGFEIEPLLRVNYHFHWQMSYLLAQTMSLKAGTELQAVAWYDNSKENPHNPDPDAAVRWGEQTYDEMMVGFFDVAVPPGLDKQHFFVRTTVP
jgi:mono/diheme cytochrome c family protein